MLTQLMTINDELVGELTCDRIEHARLGEARLDDLLGLGFIGPGFACSWEQEHGLYVRWRDGKVGEVGGVERVL